MKKLLLCLLLSLAAFSSQAVDFSSNFTTGTKTVRTTGDVKITGTDKSWSNVELKGIKGDYDITVYPCSGCATDVNKGNDYSVIGDFKSWEESTTQLNITQTIDNTATGTICEVSTELGAFKAGNSSERLSHVNITTMDNQSVTEVSGGSEFSGKIYDTGVEIGSINEGNTYNQTVKTNLQTITTEHKTSYNVKSYFD